MPRQDHTTTEVSALGPGAVWRTIATELLPEGWRVVALEHSSHHDGFVRVWEGSTPCGWTRVTISIDFSGEADEIIEVEVAENLGALGLAGKMREPYDYELDTVAAIESIIADNEELIYE